MEREQTDIKQLDWHYSCAVDKDGQVLTPEVAKTIGLNSPCVMAYATATYNRASEELPREVHVTYDISPATMFGIFIMCAAYLIGKMSE